MNKKDKMEIKKLYKKDSCNITTLYTAYFDAEGELICEEMNNLLKLKDENEKDFFKFMDIQKKLISLKSMDLDFTSEESENIKKVIKELNNNKLKSPEVIKIFIENLKEAYLKEVKGNFIINLAVDTYDVPAKTTDGFKVDESEEVYNYILCSISPVSTSKAGLGYVEEDNRIGSRYQDWIVNPPETGFIYPSFTDRSSDDRTITYFYKKKIYDTVITDFLNCSYSEDDLEVEPPKMIKATEDDLDNLAPVEVPSSVESILTNDNDEDTQIPSLPTEVIDLSELEAYGPIIKEVDYVPEEYDMPKQNLEDNPNLELDDDDKKFEKLQDFKVDDIKEIHNEDTEEIIDNYKIEENEIEENETLSKLVSKINMLLDEHQGSAEVQIINGKKFLMIPME